jgi:hypothetical protein
MINFSTGARQQTSILSKAEAIAFCGTGQNMPQSRHMPRGRRAGSKNKTQRPKTTYIGVRLGEALVGILRVIDKSPSTALKKILTNPSDTIALLMEVQKRALTAAKDEM